MALQMKQFYRNEPQLSEKARRLLAAHDHEVRRDIRPAQSDDMRDAAAAG